MAQSDLEHWPERDFGEVERDFLYEEATRRVSELIAWSDRQEQKVVYIFGIAVALIGASGLFGDLALTWDLRGLLSSVAVVWSMGALAFSTYLYWPRVWETGVDVDWMRRWTRASERNLRDAGLEALIDSFNANRKLLQERGARLPYQIAIVGVQAVLVAGVQLAAGPEVTGPSSAGSSDVQPATATATATAEVPAP